MVNFCHERMRAIMLTDCNPASLGFSMVAMAIVALGALTAAADTGEGKIPSLKEVYKDDFLIGVAIGNGLLTNDDKTGREMVASQFNALTCENEMKWDFTEPREGFFTFEQADEAMAFAEKHGMTVIGHTLVWHKQTPPWVFQGPDGNDAPRDLLIDRMRKHIQTVVGRYRGRIRGWDVVNEAVTNDANAPALRNTPWRRIIGEDYVTLAYEFAHQADPNAELYYNDYNTEDPVKRDRIIRLIKGLMERGIPIHAVGMQAHWNIQSPSLEEIERSITMFAALGVKVNITELDMSLFIKEQKDNRYKDFVPSEVLAKQAARYAAVFEIFRRNRGKIERVTFWGASDRYTWLNYLPEKRRADYPLLFDRLWRPKPAFWAVIDPAAFLSRPANLRC